MFEQRSQSSTVVSGSILCSVGSEITLHCRFFVRRTRLAFCGSDGSTGEGDVGRGVGSGRIGLANGGMGTGTGCREASLGDRIVDESMGGFVATGRTAALGDRGTDPAWVPGSAWLACRAIRISVRALEIRSAISWLEAPSDTPRGGNRRERVSALIGIMEGRT